MKLGVVFVAVLVALGLFGHVGFQRRGQVDASLVGQGQEHPKDVGHFVAKVPAGIARLLTLLPIASGEDACQLAHLFCEDGEVGEFVEVAHPDRLDPLMHLVLGLAEKSSDEARQAALARRAAEEAEVKAAEAAEKSRRDTGAPVEKEAPATVFDYYKPPVLEPVYVGGYYKRANPWDKGKRSDDGAL